MQEKCEKLEEEIKQLKEHLSKAEEQNRTEKAKRGITEDEARKRNDEMG